jgi:predicted nucleic acid-binding protein
VIVVVADTSPLNYLIQIKADHVLPALYARVFVPDAVVEELRHPHAVAAVRTWLTHVPAWLLVQHVDEWSDARLARLDRGERHAIQLATREQADLLLMDEKLGVRIAREQGLAVTGTLGVLLQAAKRGLVDMDRALTELQGTELPLQQPSD